ncbi:disintegrin and metalloproteinase domain-containing protein 10 [Lampris incognitus]|uniref:disintegrin and metalloproteinase domain-containing protein 10 n=1 Tax=Lampris incognitus TaxID=2546036 RepID=UPI0024B4A6AD|nr:disintegrin and metalloproteinase domain-containing protein 10 [Lampris incognitus]
MRFQCCCPLLLLLLLLHCYDWMTGAVCGISPYIRHYEGLSYDREDLHRRQLRSKREAHPQDHTLQLIFTAFCRKFRLRLRRDTTGLSDHFTVVGENASTVADLSHLYSGELEGEQDSSCHGSVLQGQFEGSIHTDNGTYYVEPVDRYTSGQTDHHSIIYHEDDMVLPSMETRLGRFCGEDRLQLLTQNLLPNKVGHHVPAYCDPLKHHPQVAPASRSKRTIDKSKTSCFLHLHADHLYFSKFRSVEAVVAQVASYMRAVNDIYDKVDFNGIKLINFQVKSLSVITEENKKDPLHHPFIGPEKLLSLFSENNWGNYCLSYLLTNRDYSGVLGLAWEGKSGNWGGICSRHTTLRGGRHSSLNTGLVTLQNYGQYLPSRHVQLTLAHELGHSLGSPHDEGSNCGDLGSSGGKGRYLMYPHATDEVRENNDKFSPCSIDHISKLLSLKKDDCFVVSDQPICGNQIVEEGEECDVGHNDSDLCCYSATEPVGTQCHLKPGKVCSPSQGLCCGQGCEFKLVGESCGEETDCQRQSVCSGISPFCPEPGPKENLTICSLGTRVCINGHCAESLCVKHGLQQCDCPGDSMKEKCHMCCQQPDKPETCASTTSSVLSQNFQRRRVALVAGAPCSTNRGYCDKFNLCRLLDADGPIARLKNSYLNLDDFEDLAEWMKAYWWAILLAILTLSAVMGCTVCLFGRTLDMSNLD